MEQLNLKNLGAYFLDMILILQIDMIHLRWIDFWIMKPEELAKHEELFLAMNICDS